MSVCPATLYTPPTVLVVDDQEPNVQLVCGFLLDEGYEVIPATSGAQALQRLESQLPDLILLDIFMPGMDGFTACKKIRQKPECAFLPVIFLSAADDAEFIVRALESGGVDYITKPFRKAELIARVRTHLALKTTRDNLARLVAEKDELMAVLAHDLKNPLTAIGLGVQSLQAKKEPTPEFIQKVGRSIETTVEEMRTSIENLLSEKARERAEFPLSFQAVNFNAVAEESAEQLRAAAGAKRITIDVTPTAEPLRVMADRQALRHIFDNLISNAVKFSPHGSTVSVELNDDPGRMPGCTITDEGPGFTKEDHLLIFQRYSRLSARPTAGESSTGLGLAIVKMLTERMQGIVSAENRADRSGAVFTLCLPPA